MTTLDSTTKHCGKCKRVFPATTEYFRIRKNGTLFSYCKTCEKQYNKEYNERHKAHLNPKRLQYYHATREERLIKAKQYRDAHREEDRARSRRYASEHKEEAIIRARRWNNEHKDHVRDNKRAYRKAHPEYGRATTHRRMARKRALPSNFSASDWRRVLAYFGHCCAVCGRGAGLWHTIAADHWIPLSDAGCPGTVPTNIVPLCHGIGGCNNEKGSRDPVLFLETKFGKRKARTILKAISDYFDSIA